MITIFTTAKPFKGEWAVRQRNAIRSWQQLSPDVEIILFGRGEGYAETAGELSIRHVQDVATNESGIPRIDAMFREVERIGRHSIRAYVNCDIILLDDFVQAIGRIPFNRYLAVAQRWDLDIGGSLDFQDIDWQKHILARVKSSGKLQYPGAIDLFVWRGEAWGELPPMVVGRGMYDQWLIYDCRRRGIPVVDVTTVVTLIHQIHDYSHVEGGHKTVWGGGEARRNLELGGGYRNMFTIQDADWQLTPNKMLRNWCRGDSERYGDVFQILHPNSKFAQLLVGRLAAELCCELARRARLCKAGKVWPMLKVMPWFFKRITSIKNG